MTTHSWGKTTASVLDGSGLSARILAAQLGHSRVSVRQDVYLGRRMTDPRVVEPLEPVALRLSSSHEKSDERSDRTASGKVM